MTWLEQRLADAPLVIIDGDRGTNYPKKSEFLDIGHCLFLNAGNVTAHGFDFSQTLFINEKKDNLLRKGKLKRHDVVLTTRGTVGNIAYYDHSVRFDHIRINSGMVILRPETNNLSARFLYFFLRSKIFSQQVTSLTTGSAQPQLPIRDIVRISMPLPPKNEQNAIVSVLGALDDKIENNRAMNETLEEMARAIFKSWFVDFDPVHAKSRGEQPAHMDAETAALFPDRFGDDGLPEGWQQAPVSHFAKIKGGKQLTKTSFVDNGPFPVFGGAGIMGRTDQYNAEGFVITVGRVGAYCGQFFSHRGKAWVNNNASHIIPHDNISGEWLITSLRAIDLNPIKKGAAQPFVSNSDISALLLTNPGKDTLRIFADTAHIFQLKIENNDAENRTLAELRDTLLPKLMSGEIRIKDAEREVGVAV